MNLISEVKSRALAPTPPFFQLLKKVGLIIAAVGTTVLAAPGHVPEILLDYAAHAVTAGTILVGICQLTVDEAKLEEKLLGSME
ncbi:hypothetical protein J0A68_20980 [Algoriphagus sp. H41]|uniref:Holin n=1 Tax=Algoriphagus oliviformis TaxID=2811231 RepID=A0ABS3C8J8_9BACT|nr:hypothetical protein [Algoriphagus oliviformis]MBN7813443.1 hypothetical protein [Algoriphagus oliviformis]